MPGRTLRAGAEAVCPCVLCSAACVVHAQVHIVQSTFGARPGHPLLRRMLWMMQEYVELEAAGEIPQLQVNRDREYSHACVLLPRRSSTLLMQSASMLSSDLADGSRCVHGRGDSAPAPGVPRVGAAHEIAHRHSAYALNLCSLHALLLARLTLAP